MAILRIDAGEQGPVTATGNAARAAVAEALAALPQGAPILIMVHGFKFCPDVTGRDPHRHILAFQPNCEDKRAVSWPAHLGFRRAKAGLAIAFGWDSRGSIWRAVRQSEGAARALASLIGLIRAERSAPVHLIAHSLGARVVLRALRELPLGSVGKVILMAGAAFEAEARAAMRSPAGRTAEVLNTVSGENLIFDLMFSVALAGGRSIGSGLVAPLPNWRDLAIDDAQSRTELLGMGFRIAPPVRTVCHWSAYLRPGMFAIYRAVLEDRIPVGSLPAARRHRKLRLPI